MSDPRSSASARLEAIGRLGFLVSICVGPSGATRCQWSVQVLSPSGEEFERPFVAGDFDHVVWIAEREIKIRGWWP